MRAVALCLAISVCMCPLASLPAVAQAESAADSVYSFDGEDLPQHTIVRSFYLRVIQVARSGSHRPWASTSLLEKVGFEQESAEETALLKAASRVEDLLNQGITSTRLSWPSSSRSTHTREQARQLARIQP